MCVDECKSLCREGNDRLRCRVNCRELRAICPTFSNPHASLRQQGNGTSHFDLEPATRIQKALANSTWLHTSNADLRKCSRNRRLDSSISIAEGMYNHPDRAQHKWWVFLLYSQLVLKPKNHQYPMIPSPKSRRAFSTNMSRIRAGPCRQDVRVHGT